MNGKVAILSNTAGSMDDEFFTEAKAIEQTLGLPVILHKSKKPKVFDEIVKHFSSDASGEEAEKDVPLE